MIKHLGSYPKARRPSAKLAPRTARADDMEAVRTLIIGAGITGLATAAALSARRDDDYLVLEAAAEIGG